MSSKHRKQEQKKLREAGAAAFRAGKHKQECPYSFGSADALHWHTGYANEQKRAERENAP